MLSSYSSMACNICTYKSEFVSKTLFYLGLKFSTKFGNQCIHLQLTPIVKHMVFTMKCYVHLGNNVG